MPQAATSRSFNTATSGDAQANFLAVANHLEQLIDQRQKQVDAAMAHYEATGVSEEYHAKELRWKSKAGEVKGIIATLRQSLQENDVTAVNAITRAGNAVAAII